MRRFVLLEHTGHPDDPAGRHVDLLLEDGDSCRTWRLAALPVAGGRPVIADPLPPHRLEWLDRLEGEVSGGRGFARRIAAGTYAPEPAAQDTACAAPPACADRFRLAGGDVQGLLWFERSGDAWTARLR